MPVVKSQVPATPDAQGLADPFSCHPDPQGPADRPDESSRGVHSHHPQTQVDRHDGGRCFESLLHRGQDSGLAIAFIGNHSPVDTHPGHRLVAKALA